LAAVSVFKLIDCAPRSFLGLLAPSSQGLHGSAANGNARSRLSAIAPPPFTPVYLLCI